MKLNPDRIYCKDCWYWEAPEDLSHVLGQCRHNGPIPNVKGVGSWPRTEPTNWCGQGKTGDMVYKLRFRS